MDIEDMVEQLLGAGVSPQTINVVSDINGYSKQTMYDILYAVTGKRNFDE